MLLNSLFLLYKHAVADPQQKQYAYNSEGDIATAAMFCPPIAVGLRAADTPRIQAWPSAPTMSRGGRSARGRAGCARDFVDAGKVILL